MIGRLESIVVELAEEKLKEKGYNHTTFAHAAFPEEKPDTAYRRWCRMRDGGQRIWLEDAWTIALALGEPLSAFIFQAEQLAKSRKAESPKDQAASG